MKRDIQEAVKEGVIMLLMFGLFTAIFFIVAFLCGFNGYLFSIRLFYILFIVFVNFAFVCLLIFVVLWVMQAPIGIK